MDERDVVSATLAVCFTVMVLVSAWGIIRNFPITRRNLGKRCGPEETRREDGTKCRECVDAQGAYSECRNDM